MGWKNPLTGAMKSRDSGPLRSIFESIEKWTAFDDRMGAAATGSGSMLNSTVTTLSFATEIEDTDSVLATTTFTVPAGGDGVWAFSGEIQLPVVAYTRTFVDVEVSGLAYRYVGGTEPFVAWSLTRRMVAGDTIVVKAFQTSAATRAYTARADLFRVAR